MNTNNNELNEQYKELNDEYNSELNNSDIQDIKNEQEDDFNIWNIGSVFKYILSKPIEFLLLISVFIIIYSVDYISRLNAAIYGVTSAIPFVGQQPQPQGQIPLQMLQKQKNKKRK